MNYELNKSEAITKQDSRKPFRPARNGCLYAGSVARNVCRELQDACRACSFGGVGLSHGRA